MEVLKSFEEKIAYAVEKIKTLKDEKAGLEKRIGELEDMMQSKDQAIDRLTAEKSTIKSQLENLFNELESIELK